MADVCFAKSTSNRSHQPVAASADGKAKRMQMCSMTEDESSWRGKKHLRDGGCEGADVGENPDPTDPWLPHTDHHALNTVVQKLLLAACGFKQGQKHQILHLLARARACCWLRGAQSWPMILIADLQVRPSRCKRRKSGAGRIIEKHWPRFCNAINSCLTPDISTVACTLPHEQAPQKEENMS